MNARQLRIIAIALGAAIIVYVAFPLLRGDGSLDVGEGFSFAVAEPIAGVAIVAAGGGSGAGEGGGAVIRLEPGTEEGAAGWTVDGFRADSLKLRDLLDVLPQLASLDIVARNPGNHAALGVGPDGRRVEVTTADGETAWFHLGDRDTRSGGYFARLPDDPVVYRLDSPAGGYLSRDRDGWRPRGIAQVDTAAVREILMRRGDREAILRRGPDEAWTLDGEAADSAVVARLLQMLPALSASGFPTAEEDAAADFSAPDATVEIFAEGSEDITGRDLVLALRLLEDESRSDWLARLADDPEAFRLSELSVNRLLPEAFFPEDP